MSAQKTFAEFFAGIGLMRLGLEQAGWKIRFANDIEPKKEKLYRNHFKDDHNHFHLGDVHLLRGEDIPDVDLATASFPCTDLSLAGRRLGLAGKQSSALWGFVKVLEEMHLRRPKLILLENVEGFLTSHKGTDFKEALIALNNIGYSVDAFIINAVHFVPQSRVRLFVVGKQMVNNGLNDKQLSFYQSEIRPKNLADFILNNPDINWSLEHLPALPSRELTLISNLDETPEDSKEWWDEERVKYFLNQTSERHLHIINQALSNNQSHYFTAFRRVRNGKSMAEVRSDGIAGCLRTPKGGSARQILVKVHKGQIRVRYFSTSEYARLMGAGDFRLSGNTQNDLYGFGDAVCVPVVQWIATNYLNPHLDRIVEYKYKNLIYDEN